MSKPLIAHGSASSSTGCLPTSHKIRKVEPVYAYGFENNSFQALENRNNIKQQDDFG